MTASIAFVGAGPTTLYALRALLDSEVRDARITVFEAQRFAGSGSPYRPGCNDPAMLSNIASVEIPPVSRTLLAWLQGRDATELRSLGVRFSDLDERAFVPRVALGRYFVSEFDTLVGRAHHAGAQVEVCTESRVIDAVNLPEGVELTVECVATGHIRKSTFDHVVLATGHQWPSRQEIRPGYFASPWPAATLSKIGPTEIGIRGSSLTAIDAAVALAGAHGRFVGRGGRLEFDPTPGTEGFRITMMSRKGILPEADFYFPLPHKPLEICTPKAIGRLIKQGSARLLDQVFDLFRRELSAVDPAYARSTDLARTSIEAFGETYFAGRATTDAFEWAAANLEEARANHALHVTVPWRDAILRMHDVVAAIVPHLADAEFSRFNRHLKPVFVDAYGAAPHESVERVLALHRAGKLQILALGDDHHIDTHCPEGGAMLTHGGRVRHFPTFIEATGQRALGAIQFPFLSLLEQGIIRDATSCDGSDTHRGVMLDEVFQPVAEDLPADRLFCLSLPFLIGRHPFIQGITSSHEMGEIVGRQLALALQSRRSALEAFNLAA